MKAPRTIMNEITSGETETVTNFVGASAAASQSAAEMPQKIPSLCSFRWREWLADVSEMVGFNAFFSVAVHWTRRSSSNPISRTRKGTQN
jgi:hypothetical protein